MTITISIHQPECRPSGCVTPNDLLQINTKLDTIMSALSDYAARVSAQFDSIEAATESLTTHVSGVEADVQSLKALIEQLQNSPGAITPEDQALLDQLEARANAASAKLTPLANALATLDAATEPPAPPTP